MTIHQESSEVVSNHQEMFRRTGMSEHERIAPVMCKVLSSPQIQNGELIQEAKE